VTEAEAKAFIQASFEKALASHVSFVPHTVDSQLMVARILSEAIQALEFPWCYFNVDVVPPTSMDKATRYLRYTLTLPRDLADELGLPP
jgi:hypothetical protein